MKTNILKSRLPFILTIIIILFAAIGLARRCQNSSSTLSNDFVKPGGDTITVAIEMSPLTYTLRNDTASGFDYEILQHIARIHNLALKFYPVSDLHEAFARLDRGDFDLLIASMPATSNLKKYFTLTEPVYIDRQVLVQLVDSDSARFISSQNQLIGDTVWIAEASPFRTRLTNMARELGDTIHISTMPGYSAEHLAIMTALGKIPRAVVSESVARRIAAQYPNLDFSTPISLSHFQSWAVAPRDSILCDSLNTWLEQFVSTSEFQTLSEHYLQ